MERAPAKHRLAASRINDVVHHQTESITIETGSRQVKTSAAFTLVELLLTVGLMLGLVGAVVINFGSLDRHARLEEGASHLETLFRYARAQAGSTGRQVRIVFDSSPPAGAGVTTSPDQDQTESTSGVQILWEANPLAAPGKFELLPGAELLVDQVNELVNVREVRQPGANTLESDSLKQPGQPNPSEGHFSPDSQLMDGASTGSQTLTCYPDGSSDSVEVVVGSANGEDKRLAVVTLSGLTGASKHRVKAEADAAVPTVTETVHAEALRAQ